MAERHAIRAGQLWTPAGLLERQVIYVADGRIQRLADWSEATTQNWPTRDAVHDVVIPGLVDLQVNGALGWSFQAEHRAHYAEITGYHLAAGTTTLLPTLVTAQLATLLAGLQELSRFLTSDPLVCLPGIHLEGPFLAPDKAGAHDVSALALPDAELARQLVQAAGARLAMVTLAPELPGALDLIRFFAAEGCVVAAGHSAATFDQMQGAVDAGLSFVTHAGNASDWPHRAPGAHGFLASEPGVVGALLALPDLAGSVILDGYHVHPALLAPLIRIKGRERLVLVSDASPVAGSPPGDYASGGLVVTVHAGGYATSGRGGGWLAGSTVTLLEAVRRAVHLAHIPLEDAVYMAATAPATVLGLAGRKGQIDVGFDADLLILGRDDLSLRGVMAGGRWVD